MVGKKVMHQNKSKCQAYSIIHFERLIAQERELEEIYAIQNDNVEWYEKKLGKYITTH